MAKIKWLEDFSVGNQEIDNQHKKWIEIYNKAHDKMMGNILIENKSNIGKDALKEMIEYGKYHFASEEDFMEKIKYQGIEKHKEIHKNLVQKLNDLDKQIQQGTYILNTEIMKIIENWIVDHIINEDQKYVR